MPIYEITPEAISRVPETRFASAGLRERDDLQRLLRDRIEVVAPDVLIISEEFGEWTDSRRRIDLLGVDKQANLVVIELKRTEDGGHMELQSLRYAAMVSKMTASRAVEVFEAYREKRGIEGSAEEALLAFLEVNEIDEIDEEGFAPDVRIVLVSADFSRELTTSVMWLNERDLDVRCVRIRPYEHAGKTLIDVQQIIPLPEAEDYLVGVREQKRRGREARQRDLTKFDLRIGENTFERLPKRRAILEVVRALVSRGHAPERLWQVIEGRSFDRSWRRVAGIVDSENFDRQAAEQAARSGLVYDPPRWFNRREELIAHDGNTYAFSAMWGVATEVVMRRLIEEFGDGTISLTARQ